MDITGTGNDEFAAHIQYIDLAISIWQRIIGPSDLFPLTNQIRIFHDGKLIPLCGKNQRSLDRKAPLCTMFNLAHSIPYLAFHIIPACIIPAYLGIVNTNRLSLKIFGYMQKSALFAPLSFLLKVQFVRQLASFSKDVCL